MFDADDIRNYPRELPRRGAGGLQDGNTFADHLLRLRFEARIRQGWAIRPDRQLPAM